MELNSDILSGLSLMNFAVIELDQFRNILADCEQTLTAIGDKQNSARETLPPNKDILIARNVLTFAINSLVLEAAKNGVSLGTLGRLLAGHLDTTSEPFQLFTTFLATVLPKVIEQLKAIQLDGGDVFQFRDIRWSQAFEVKSSILESVREKSYVIDIEADRAVGQLPTKLNGTRNQQQPTEVKHSRETISMSITQRELQDLYTSLLDCAKNVERIINK